MKSARLPPARLPQDIYHRLDTMSTADLEAVARIYRGLSASRDDPRSRYTKIFYRAYVILDEHEHKTKSRAVTRLPDCPAAPDC